MAEQQEARSFRYGGASGRRTAILQRLSRGGYVSLSDLGQELGVSERTIRRDLGDLADQGAVQLVPGGAIRATDLVRGRPPATRHIPEITVKRELARAASALVSPSDSVALDAGTTAACIAEALVDIHPLTVISHSVSVIEILSEQPGISLIATGGSFDYNTRAFLGPMARENLKSLRASIAFVACSGIIGSEFACESQPDAEIKQTLVRMSRKTIVVASASVFSRMSPIVAFGFDQVDTVITDDRITAADRDSLIRAGIDVVTVPAPGHTSPALVEH